MEHKSSGDSVESVQNAEERYESKNAPDIDGNAFVSDMGDGDGFDSDDNSLVEDNDSFVSELQPSVETQDSGDAMLFGARKSTKQAWTDEQAAKAAADESVDSSVTGWNQEEKEKEAAILVRQNYIDQAFQNYSNKKYKEAMVLLRKIELNDQPSIAVLANCAYDFWRSVQTQHEFMPHFNALDKNTQIFGKIMGRSTQKIDYIKSIDQQEANESVHKAFTQLFGTGDKAQLVAFDYIRLSHVYICEGALSGALQILQLGQARGHLENLLIVIQLWSVLKRLRKKHIDAELCMQYLVTAVQLEEREAIEDSGECMKCKIYE